MGCYNSSYLFDWCSCQVLDIFFFMFRKTDWVKKKNFYASTENSITHLELSTMQMYLNRLPGTFFYHMEKYRRIIV